MRTIGQLTDATVDAWKALVDEQPEDTRDSAKPTSCRVSGTFVVEYHDRRSNELSEVVIPAGTELVLYNKTARPPKIKRYTLGTFFAEGLDMQVSVRSDDTVEVLPLADIAGSTLDGPPARLLTTMLMLRGSHI